MGVLLGALTSLLFGSADFLGGEGAKRAPASAVVLWAGLLSFPLIAVVALVVGGDATTRDMVLGAAAGSSGVLGLVYLFAGLGKGHAAAVAPAAGAVTGIFPVGVAVLIGERPSALAWFGVVVAVPAIVLSAWVAEPGDIRFGGLGYGVVAGLGFGGATVLFGQTATEAGLLPLIPSRGATIVVVLVMAATGLWKVTSFSGVPRGITIGNGSLDVAGNVTLLLALHSGSLALVAIASSLYPAVTVVMARLINDEHLRKRQMLGLGLTILALAAIAAG